ncbi:hypothetical protein, partial [Streptomyces sp. ms184]|uniref:hypothetical protein n=1 Tax=Streptomyces sp. ms184 TaxID=1827974 RepID=UPI00359C4549
LAPSEMCIRDSRMSDRRRMRRRPGDRRGRTGLAPARRGRRHLGGPDADRETAAAEGPADRPDRGDRPRPQPR